MKPPLSPLNGGHLSESCRMLSTLYRMPVRMWKIAFGYQSINQKVFW
jgi:hypothetical protein